MDQKDIKRQIGGLKRAQIAARKRYKKQLADYLRSHLGATEVSFRSNIPAHIESLGKEIARLEAQIEEPAKKRRT